ncbi:SubName: Full=Uncharacterized protein {ECO:0000313/EMBL:CCA74632.1} [Serendipita indica DSM 11827]|uniref:Uncharacterized protein n=1 Tax=Serendipita indica (strain DSM 11827) TaxID=1109443 RepID=G4TTI9_SERID|nr:SubName: Full=Uncharacterized protein {ECO:0000313/EMBL:CCA74632.1} [Serendipita indica DSM 11827]CCA74632.1 hypothetical protein PIIN_08584 [Serendipita indica DSM 11827]
MSGSFTFSTGHYPAVYRELKAEIERRRVLLDQGLPVNAPKRQQITNANRSSDPIIPRSPPRRLRPANQRRDSRPASSSNSQLQHKRPRKIRLVVTRKDQSPITLTPTSPTSNASGTVSPPSSSTTPSSGISVQSCSSSLGSQSSSSTIRPQIRKSGSQLTPALNTTPEKDAPGFEFRLFGLSFPVGSSIWVSANQLDGSMDMLEPSTLIKILKYHYHQYGLSEHHIRARSRYLGGFHGISPYDITTGPGGLATLNVDKIRRSSKYEGLHIRVHIHLLGMRGITYLSSGVWEISNKDKQTCTRDRFILQLPKSSSDIDHNVLASDIFAANFVSALKAGYYGEDYHLPISNRPVKDTIVQAFYTVLDGHIRAQSSGSNNDNDRQNRRHARRIAKWLRLLDVAGSFPASPLSFGLKAAGADACSSDESDDEGNCQVYRPKLWRSRKLNGFISAVRSSGYYLELRAGWSHKIEPSVRALPSRVPKRFIDDEWLENSLNAATALLELP